MLPPPANAMLTGMQQGDQQAQSIIPSTYQPQGKAAPQNPWEGVLSLINSQILEVASGVGKQGQAYRAQSEKLLKIAYEIKKINNQLLDIAIKGQNNGG